MLVKENTVEIKNEDDLSRSIELVNEHLQSINNYLNENPHQNKRIKFPRGYIGTADSYSKRYSWLIDKTLQRNLSYQYVFYDVLRWVGNRTDLYGLARHILYKQTILIVASIAESLLVGFSKQQGWVERKPLVILEKIYKGGGIKQKTYNNFHWVWGIRNNVHIHLVNEREYEKYTIEDAKKAQITVSEIEKNLALYVEVLSAF